MPNCQIKDLIELVLCLNLVARGGTPIRPERCSVVGQAWPHCLSLSDLIGDEFKLQVPIGVIRCVRVEELPSSGNPIRVEGLPTSGNPTPTEPSVRISRTGLFSDRFTE